jgi:hypothetical protein
MKLEKMMKGKKIILVEYPKDFNIELLNKKKLTFPFKYKLQFKNTGNVLEMKPLTTRIKKKYKNQFRILSKGPKGKYHIIKRKFDEIIKLTKSVSKKNN